MIFTVFPRYFNITFMKTIILYTITYTIRKFQIDPIKINTIHGLSLYRKFNVYVDN